MLYGKNYGTKADVFSLGCIFHLLLFGNHAFVAKEYNDTISNNRKCDYESILAKQLETPGNHCTE